MKYFDKKYDYIVHDESNIKGFFGDYRWLSNFFSCEVFLDGHWFPSVEHGYVWSKLPVDKRDDYHLTQCRILPPDGVKKYGRKLPLRSDWERVKYDVMASLVFDKFYRDNDLRQLLLDTGSRYIEETNHWGDTYWGVCEGNGQNRLGQILMSVRTFWQEKEGKRYVTKTKLF